ncbi:MAG: hypothetical protein HZA17_03915 [Nitrospirae bacterium]|nr:hypothetical protein [Nitrospirota bacterium]
MTERIKPSLNFTIICDDIRQEIGGKISLMGLFENIYATKFPAIHPRIAIMNEWSEGRGEFEATMRIFSPDKKSVLRETSSRIKLGEVTFRHRDASVHLNLDFTTPGTYWIENYLDNELINSIPLKVVQVKEQSVH